jgi:hypothetical protein
MSKITKPSIMKRSEHGFVVFTILAMAIVGGFLVFAMVYNIFFQLRENTDEDRLAQSAAVVAVKAYVRAGSEPDPLSQRQQIAYALDAAARVLNIDTGLSKPISQIAIPALSRTEFETSSDQMPSTPITVILWNKDNNGDEDTMAPAAEITVGRVTGSEAPYLVEGFSGDPALDVTIGARVLVHGTIRSNRATIFPGYFGTMLRTSSEAQVLVLYDSKRTQTNVTDAITIIKEKPGSFNPSTSD